MVESTANTRILVGLIHPEQPNGRYVTGFLVPFQRTL